MGQGAGGSVYMQGQGLQWVTDTQEEQSNSELWFGDFPGVPVTKTSP